MSRSAVSEPAAMRRWISTTESSDKGADPPTAPGMHPGKLPREVAANDAMPKPRRNCRRFVMSFDQMESEVSILGTFFSNGPEATATTDVTKVIIAEHEDGGANHRNKSLWVPVRSKRTWKSFSVRV